MRSSANPLALSVLLISSCATPLDEYQCTAIQDCIRGSIAGRCEISGHCSFPDRECTSGFRFGKSSGAETDLCVDGVTAWPDGEPDALNGPVPVARIADVDLPCGQTSALFEGDGSTASSGATLVDYEWTIFERSGEVASQISLAPGQTVDRSSFHRGGDHDGILLNLTPYHNERALNVVLNDEQLTAIIHELPNLEISQAQSYRLFFALASEESGVPQSLVTVSIENSLGQPVFFSDVMLSETMEAYSMTFLASSGAFAPPYVLIFRFENEGTYWLDNVALVDPNGQIVSTNESIELEVAPWGKCPKNCV